MKKLCKKYTLCLNFNILIACAAFRYILPPCQLNGLPADIDKQAEDMFFRLVKQMAECESVTEQLQAKNQMGWVTGINNIRSRVDEIINNDLIYT